MPWKRSAVKSMRHYAWSAYFCPPFAFWTEDVKNSSLKKSKEPKKSTRALFLACWPAISSVFWPTAWGYSVILLSGSNEYAVHDACKTSSTSGLSGSAVMLCTHRTTACCYHVKHQHTWNTFISFVQVTWLVVTEVQRESFGLARASSLKRTFYLVLAPVTAILLFVVECNRRHIFRHRVWYRVLSLRYVCIRSAGFIVIP